MEILSSTLFEKALYDTEASLLLSDSTLFMVRQRVLKIPFFSNFI